MNLYESTVLLNHLPDLTSGLSIGSDGGTDGYPAVFGNFARHKPDTPDVNIPVFLRKTKFTGKVTPDNIPVEKRYGSEWDLWERTKELVEEQRLNAHVLPKQVDPLGE